MGTCSWRHTPFRNSSKAALCSLHCSWRHTPFRNSGNSTDEASSSSWRHTPSRKLLQRLQRIAQC
ncbi:hypothetical protein ACG9HW_16360, partial [Acinetobacter ursingii]